MQIIKVPWTKNHWPNVFGPLRFLGKLLRVKFEFILMMKRSQNASLWNEPQKFYIELFENAPKHLEMTTYANK